MDEMHKIDALPALIIGRRDDNGVQTIHFDCSPWAEIYPAMSEYRLEMSINGVRFAPLRQSYDNRVLTWTVSEQDTAVAGAGRYEITATGANGQRKTSTSATVYVDDRIPGTALGVPPDYVAPLLDRIAEIVAGAGGGNVSPEQIQQAVESYLAENPVKVDEQDPTVPDWAKQSKKPTYTAQEVGAMPADAEIVDNAARQGVAENTEAISQLSEEIAELRGEGEEAKDVLLTPGEDYVVTESKSISLNVALGEHYITDTAAGYYSVAEVDVKAGERYKISTTTKYNSGGYPDTVGVIFTDGTGKKYIAPTEYDIFLGVTSTSATRVNDAEVTVPSGAVKMLVNSLYLSTDAKNGIIIKKVVGGGGTQIPSDPLLYGKKLSLNGDSICYGAGSAGGYGKIIADRCGMRLENISVSGATIAAETYADDGTTAKHWICRTIGQMDANADFVILEGGVNDVTNADLGEFSPTNYDAVLDDTTFCGAFESMLKQAILHFDHAKICYLAVHKMSVGFSSNTEEDSYYYAALDICKKWGIPVIDLNIAVPPLGMYTTDEGLLALRHKYTHNGDGWHPNADGYNRYYVDAIIAALKAL